MNSVVSVASLASATAVAAPSIEGPDHPEQTAAEQLARVEQMIDLLRTRHIRDGWALDEAAAERVLEFFRTSVQYPTTHSDQPGYDDEWTFVIQFINEHGQSFDWLLAGDVGGMICQAAASSDLAAAISSRKMTSYYEEFSALQRRRDVHNAVFTDDVRERLHDAVCNVPPELAIIEEDIALIGPRSATMDRRASPSWAGWELKEKLERRLSKKARARVRQLLAAWDKYWDVDVRKVYDETGATAAAEALDNLDEQIDAIMQRVYAAPVQNFGDLALKARMLKAWDADQLWKAPDDDADWDVKMTRNFIDSVIALRKPIAA